MGYDAYAASGVVSVVPCCFSRSFYFPREELMTQEVDNSRRRMLTTVTSGVGLIGAGAMAVPFVASMAPSARAKAAGA
ncbi:uncharacterized protein METZ01_LOCUS362349, partial [marine metagenome]